MFPAFFTRQIILILVALFAAASALAAPPKITRLSVRGLQTGGTTTVTIQGRDLLPEPTIVLGVPIKQQQVLEKATETKLQIAVTLDANVTAGIYNLRLANRKGISSPLIVAVDSLPQVPLKENVDAMPVALHGTLTGSAVHTTSFEGKAGQEITIEVESQRIGAKLRPVLRLYDANRRQIAASLPMSELAGDTRLITKLPADGKYTVEINDLQYATPAPGDYRLKIGLFNYADAVFPPAVARGKPSVVELIGNFPNTNQAQVSTTDGEVVPASWPSGSTPTGPRPRVIVSDIAELIEDVPQATPQSLLAIPSAVSGRLSAAAEEDVYQLKVTAGDKLRFEVFAARIGSPLDAVLEVRNEKGGRLALNDDAVGPDPRVDYTVPKNVPVVHVAIKDAHRRGGDRCIYRLVVTRVRDAAKTGFRLTAVSDTYNIAPQNSHLFQVRIERQGYDGPIQLTVAGLAAGMKADPVEVPAGATGAIIALQNQNKMEAGEWAPATVTIRGESKDVSPSIVRVAHVANHPLGKLQPWLATNFAVAQAERAKSEFSFAWGEVPKEIQIYQGVAFTAAVKFQRAPGAIGPIRLSLVTSQPPPLVKGKPNANLAMRGEKPTIDIPIDPKAKAALDAFNAAEKALAGVKAKLPSEGEPDPQMKKALDDAQAKRDDAEKKLREAEAKLTKTGEFKIIIPPNLPINRYDLALKAELRSLDNKTVLAEAFTTVRRFQAASPLVLSLSPGPKFETTLDPKTGATIALTGKIERKTGFTGEVNVTIAGQPRGIAVPKTVIKADQTDFSLELKIPANFAATEIKTIKVTASGPPNPKQKNIIVKVETPIEITVGRLSESSSP